MLKFVCVLALAAVAQGGAPIGYGGYSTGLGYAGVGGIATGGLGYSSGLGYAGHAGYATVAHAPVAVAHAVRHEAYDPHPQYNYGYSVSDGLTGDHHSAHESRDGDVVKGEYSLVEPDGAIRTVTYTADGINGFNAIVNRQAPARAVVAHAAPAIAIRAAPVAIAHHAIAAPVAVAHHGGYAAQTLGYGGAAYGLGARTVGYGGGLAYGGASYGHAGGLAYHH